MPDSLSSVIGFFSGLSPYGGLAIVISVVFIISLWRSRHKTEARTTSSQLPWTVSLSSFPPEDRSSSSQAALQAQQDFSVKGQIASLSTKKAVFITPTNTFPVGHKVYFSFESAHFSGQYFCGQVNKVKQDPVSDEFRLTLAVLDKPFSLSRAMLKKLMLPIAS